MAVTLNGSGQVPVQVISATKTDVFSVASSTYTDVTGLSVTVTPTSASSRILIFANVLVATSSANDVGSIQIVRNSTAIGNNTSGSAASYGISGSDGSSGDSQRAFTSAGLTILDSPATTSATTYKIQLRANSGTVYVNRWALNSDWVGSSSITVMEISG
jgi:hypothetical protein